MPMAFEGQNCRGTGDASQGPPADRCSLACPQVNIPVLVPGQPPMSIALLGLQRSDMRLLHVAAKLGPVILRMAQEHAAQKVGSFLGVLCPGQHVMIC